MKRLAKAVGGAMITKIERLLAPYSGILAGTRHYPLGDERQVLYLKTETPDVLLRSFGELHGRVRKHGP